MRIEGLRRGRERDRVEERGSGKELKLPKDTNGDVVDIDFEQQ